MARLTGNHSDMYSMTIPMGRPAASPNTSGLWILCIQMDDLIHYTYGTTGDAGDL